MTIFVSLSRIFYTNCPIRQKGKRYMRCTLFLSLSLFKRPPLNDAPLFYAIRSSSRASSVRNFQQYQAPESSSAETRRLLEEEKREMHQFSPTARHKKSEFTHIQICVLKTKQTTESGCALCENGWRRFVLRIRTPRIHSKNIYDGEEARRSFSMMMDLREENWW